MTTKKGKYERASERADRGIFSLVEPFDYLILEQLPEVGTLFAGLYPLGETAAALMKKFPKPPGGATIPTTMVTGRLHSLQDQGIVKKGPRVPGQTASIWQRTKRGTKLFDEWAATHRKATTKGTDGSGSTK